MGILEWVGGVSTNSPAGITTETLVVIEDSSPSPDRFTNDVPVVLFAKYPEPGRVKTRLGAHVGFERATEWAKALLVASLRRFGTIPGAPLILAGDRPTREPYAHWLPPEVGYCVQGEGSLGDRLTRIFGEPPRLDGAMPPGVIALGADAPHLDPTVIARAADAIRRGEFALGPAEDGGYYLLGVPCGAVDLGALFPKSGWGESGVLARTRRVLTEAPLPPQRPSARRRDPERVTSDPEWTSGHPRAKISRTVEFGTLRDIDTWDDVVPFARDWIAAEDPQESAREGAGLPGGSDHGSSAASFIGLREHAPELWDLAHGRGR